MESGKKPSLAVKLHTPDAGSTPTKTRRRSVAVSPSGERRKSVQASDGASSDNLQPQPSRSRRASAKASESDSLQQPQPTRARRSSIVGGGGGPSRSRRASVVGGGGALGSDLNVPQSRPRRSSIVGGGGAIAGGLEPPSTSNRRASIQGRKSVSNAVDDIKRAVALKEMTDKHEAEKAAMKEEYEKKISDLKQQLEDTVSGLKSTHSTALKENEEKVLERLARQARLENMEQNEAERDLRSEIEAEIEARHEDDKKKLRDRIDYVNTNMQKLNLEVNEYKKQISALQASNEALHKERLKLSERAHRLADVANQVKGFRTVAKRLIIRMYVDLWKINKKVSTIHSSLYFFAKRMFEIQAVRKTDLGCLRRTRDLGLQSSNWSSGSASELTAQTVNDFGSQYRTKGKGFVHPPEVQTLHSVPPVMPVDCYRPQTDSPTHKPGTSANATTIKDTNIGSMNTTFNSTSGARQIKKKQNEAKPVSSLDVGSSNDIAFADMLTSSTDRTDNAIVAILHAGSILAEQTELELWEANSKVMLKSWFLATEERKRFKEEQNTAVKGGAGKKREQNGKAAQREIALRANIWKQLHQIADFVPTLQAWLEQGVAMERQWSVCGSVLFQSIIDLASRCSHAEAERKKVLKDSAIATTALRKLETHQTSVIEEQRLKQSLAHMSARLGQQQVIDKLKHQLTKHSVAAYWRDQEALKEQLLSSDGATFGHETPTSGLPQLTSPTLQPRKPETPNTGPDNFNLLNDMTYATQPASPRRKPLMKLALEQEWARHQSRELVSPRSPSQLASPDSIAPLRSYYADLRNQIGRGGPRAHSARDFRSTSAMSVHSYQSEYTRPKTRGSPEHKGRKGKYMGGTDISGSSDKYAWETYRVDTPSGPESVRFLASKTSPRKTPRSQGLPKYGPKHRSDWNFLDESEELATTKELGHLETKIEAVAADDTDEEKEY